jgi:hypothetical protein
MNMRLSMWLWIPFVAACAGQKPAAQAPAPPPAAVAAPPEPAAPVAAVPPTPPDPAPPAAVPQLITAAPCGGRKATFALARATGMGSYVTTLTCGQNEMFTFVSDRATPDHKEIKQAFQVSPLDWEKAWRALDAMQWRTLDDRCTERERAAGRGDGPVYRITIEDNRDKRTFICAGLRDLTAPLDAVQTQVQLLAPPEVVAPPTAEVGVAECDDYLERYQRCVNTKVPPAQRHGFLDAIDLTRRGLHDTLLRNPDAGAALASQCKDMLTAARSAMGSFKCKL